ncbi:hypothetical protein ALC53_12373 [Atta colombica]|uniref:Uncharacterized protein n=1 Tax=Atta colombica TaxID=520822 RepID=A0A151HZA8_9HYME|nr:hypothetical protein ALC53_12373 [Atta colombica]
MVSLCEVHIEEDTWGSDPITVKIGISFASKLLKILWIFFLKHPSSKLCRLLLSFFKTIDISI